MASSYTSQKDPRPYTIISNDVLYNPDSLYNTFLSNADNVFTLYGDYDKYTSFFDATNYFNTLQDIDLIAQDVNTLQVELKKNKDAVSKTTKIDISDIDFTGNSRNDDVSVQLVTSTDNEEDEIYNVCQAIIDNLKRDFTNPKKIGQEQQSNNSSSLSEATIGDEITFDHLKMHYYMDSIIESLTRYKYKVIKNLITNMATDNIDSLVIKRACSIFSSLWESQLYIIITTLNTSLEEYLYKFVENADLKNLDELMGCIKSVGFSDSTNVYTSMFYFQLRNHLVLQLKNASVNDCSNILKNIRNVEGEDVVSYFIKISADAYIKCSYPLIQYKFLYCLMKRFMKAGDFVNTRLGLFSKIYFVLYLVSVLSISIKNITSIDSDTLNVIQIPLNDIISKLNKYMENINRIDLADPSTTSDIQLGKIQKTLYTLSNKVKKEADKNRVIQKDIQNLRVLIRNVNFNNEIIKNNNNWKKKELMIATISLVVLLIVCSCIMAVKFEMREKLIYYIAGLVLLCVLAYKVVLYVFAEINKN